jgi:hypothetical protein
VPKTRANSPGHVESVAGRWGLNWIDERTLQSVPRRLAPAARTVAQAEPSANTVDGAVRARFGCRIALRSGHRRSRHGGSGRGWRRVAGWVASGRASERERPRHAGKRPLGVGGRLRVSAGPGAGDDGLDTERERAPEWARLEIRAVGWMSTHGHAGACCVANGQSSHGERRSTLARFSRAGSGRPSVLSRTGRLRRLGGLGWRGRCDGSGHRPVACAVHR